MVDLPAALIGKLLGPLLKPEVYVEREQAKEEGRCVRSVGAAHEVPHTQRLLADAEHAFTVGAVVGQSPHVLGLPVFAGDQRLISVRVTTWE